MTRRWITVPNYAALWSLSPRTVTRGIEAGRLEAIKIVGRWRVPADAILISTKEKANG